MKKIFLSLLIFYSFQLSAQYKYYKDSSYTQAFSLLTGAQSVNNGQWWDDDQYVVPLGFNFRLFNDSVQEVTIGGAGALVSSTPDPDNANYITGIVAHGSDLIDRDSSGNSSMSPISYTTSGTAPNRICKIEWIGAGFYNATSNGFFDDSVNFQLWLYETTNVIEVHFGNGNYISSFTDLYDDGPGVWCGLIDSLDVNSPTGACRIMYNFAGNMNSPHLDSVFSLDFNVPPGVTGNPAPGMVYRFSPKVAAGGGLGYETTNEIVPFDFEYFKSAEELRLNIYSDEQYYYSLCDMNGRIWQKGSTTKGRQTISTRNLQPGMYMFKLNSAHSNTSHKFVR